MVGRTNALIGALVSSVNGMTGAVILNANIAYDPSIEYDENTIGDTLKQGGGGGGAVQSVNGMTCDVVLPPYRYGQRGHVSAPAYQWR